MKYNLFKIEDCNDNRPCLFALVKVGLPVDCSSWPYYDAGNIDDINLVMKRVEQFNDDQYCKCKVEVREVEE